MDSSTQNGCPFSAADMAAAFDPFSAEYALDPAQTLAWSREQAPVFFAPKLGYWVVSRYDDVKAVFRDNQTYSPSIALEKITPFSDEAMAVLMSYGYAMNRTLVNEDEPAHMARRRLLLDHFYPENLVDKQAMVRRLTREKVDGFIARGEADLVAEMLYEVPLTVALHFLGVPEDDIPKLKEFSVAHTVNTWGRPTPEQQLEVAHAVGKFWQYAGEVLDKMRAEPDGEGWMHFAIRQNAKHPDIVTDSYLHSMMMAIIVAAHETTAHASANMFRLLLEQRDAWNDLCANPSLIPNAVEECLRLGGSIVAWRRQATRKVSLGGVEVPEGAKLLIVMASANQDGHKFENPTTLDLYRSNTADHLTFGYGSHQCMGKNIGRMEMRIFLEELTRRIPGLRLAEQQFSYLPNTSFRGPDQLWVTWDVDSVPELASQPTFDAQDFPIGAPQRDSLTRKVIVESVVQDTDDVLLISLKSANGRPLPAWSAGAHIDLLFADYARKYSLCGVPDASSYQIAVLREDMGRGASRWLHQQLKVGAELSIRGPSNLFRLQDEAEKFVLIAGGIGITPILAMADQLKSEGKPYVLHYAARSAQSFALRQRLNAHAQALQCHCAQDNQRMDLASIVAALPANAVIYACGPTRLLNELTTLCDQHAVPLRLERFHNDTALLETQTEFEVELVDSGLSLTVGADQTLLEALQAAGIDVASDCGEGLCGSCEVGLLAGDVDHRDQVLTAGEKQQGQKMMACCSRAKPGGALKLSL